MVSILLSCGGALPQRRMLISVLEKMVSDGSAVNMQRAL
jgi:hypothetical protein